jgi:DNA recombination protein RmuC
MSFSLPELILLAVAALMFAAVVMLVARMMSLSRAQADLAVRVTGLLEAKHLSMLKDLNLGLNALGDRIADSGGENSERLRNSVDLQLKSAREALVALQISQSQDMAANREQLLQRVGEIRSDILEKALGALAEQGKSQSETLQDSVRSLALQLTGSIETLTRTADARLAEIQGKVNERLEEGFRKTNETFVSVMERLATIDEAQKKIDGLTTNVVSLQELLGDKRSRGAFGEVQLEALVRNVLPPSAYAFQVTLSNGNRADCLLKLPEPTGSVVIDSKFPLENYHRMFEAGQSEIERFAVQKQFRADIRKHVDDIATRYILPGETSDGAVMFIPAEAVFAEIHARHSEVVDHAMQQRVWIVSPTTMMAVLNTARAVIKDVETRRQVHVIKDELSKLGRDFVRFEQRMKKLADHIRQAHDDAQQVQISSDKIVRRFTQIEKVELDGPADRARLEAAADAPEPEASDWTSAER